MSYPWLSVIVPVYNVAPYIHKTLDSVVAAVDKLVPSLVDHSGFFTTHSPLVEIICIDDGSSDGSGAILDGYFEELKNSAVFPHLFSPPFSSSISQMIAVRIVHQKNAGVSVARNRGLELAHGEWVGFLDGDDWWRENLLTWFFDCVGRHPEVEVVGFGTEFVDDQGVTLRRYERIFEHVVLPEGDLVLRSVGYGDYGANACNKFFRRSMLVKSGVKFVPGLRNGEDTLFATLVLSCSGPVLLDSSFVGYCYLERGASASHRQIAHMPKDPLCLFRQMNQGWRRNRKPGLKRKLARYAAGALSLCCGSLYAHSARLEAIDYLKRSRELRTEVWPFVLLHGWWRTKLVLTAFVIGPKPIKHWVLRRFCGDLDFGSGES